MRTNIVLDEALVRRGMELTGARTKRDLVHTALEELVRSRTRKNLLDLAGRLSFRDDFEPDALGSHDPR
ncbi:MAG: type II toxin-antitoxin system VapB family antitoxin [Thermoanaerobaculia bacterium]|nr:type II toxin-antitoxin system VapB family antitoxin [Thermoanaerobaculia bacterium]